MTIYAGILVLRHHLGFPHPVEGHIIQKVTYSPSLNLFFLLSVKNDSRKSRFYFIDQSIENASIIPENEPKASQLGIARLESYLSIEIGQSLELHRVSHQIIRRFQEKRL